jgi:hypothetical protein
MEDKVMTVTRKDGKLTIVIDEASELVPSSTGKTLVVASSHGNVATSINIDGRPLKVGVNAFIDNPKYKKE